MVEYKLFITYLPIGHVLKILWHFEILTWEPMENLKCGISRKRLSVEQYGQKCGTRGTTVHISKGTFDARFLEFN